MTTQLQLDQRCEKGRALTKSGCDCLSTSRTYFHGKAQWTAARASYLFRPLALVLFSFMVGISLGCGGSAKITSVNSKTTSFCPPGHNVRTDLRIGQRHRWCETRRGIAHGPVKVFYPDGSAMLSFELIDGRIHGLYQAWHPRAGLQLRQHISMADSWAKPPSDRLLGRRVCVNRVGAAACKALWTDRSVLRQTFNQPSRTDMTNYVAASKIARQHMYLSQVGRLICSVRSKSRKWKRKMKPLTCLSV